MKASSERVSTVGMRYQVTLPKVIRENAKIKEKMVAYIHARDKEDSLVITLNPPGEGVYNRIKISEKGQLVIPKNLRESKHIKQGNNLVFNIEGDQEITVKKLAERRRERDANWRWQFFIEIIEMIGTIPELDRLDIENDSLVLTMKKELDSTKLLELVMGLENNLGKRLMVEKNEKKINLRPMSR
ncbi:MAG: AbrB/MazE/SpoVT family DNA-binding domain-containing protein [Candidatus Odinarchaeota archaeon]